MKIPWQYSFIFGALISLSLGLFLLEREPEFFAGFVGVLASGATLYIALSANESSRIAARASESAAQSARISAMISRRAQDHEEQLEAPFLVPSSGDFQRSDSYINGSDGGKTTIGFDLRNMGQGAALNITIAGIYDKIVITNLDPGSTSHKEGYAGMYDFDITDRPSQMSIDYISPVGQQWRTIVDLKYEERNHKVYFSQIVRVKV